MNANIDDAPTILSLPFLASRLCITPPGKCSQTIVPLIGAAMACVEAHRSTCRGADGHIVEPIARLCPIIGLFCKLPRPSSRPPGDVPGEKGVRLVVGLAPAMWDLTVSFDKIGSARRTVGGPTRAAGLSAPDRLPDRLPALITAYD